MKLSISWIFDHIDGQWRSIPIEQLMDKCIQTTAEIEGFYKVSCDLSLFTLGHVSAVNPTTITVFSPELNKEFLLPSRQMVETGSWYLIKTDGTWATMKDLGSAKEHQLPALYIPETLRSGSWKKQFEAEDYIIEVDNKSINNRPDLWGHRGFAREIAAMFNLQLKPLEPMLADILVHTYGNQSTPTATNDLTIQNQAFPGCKRFAALPVTSIDSYPSLLWMASRLCRVDSKPISAIVDTTNYVMFDLGQPLHAFDAQAVATKTIAPRYAQHGEKLQLLDGAMVSLTKDDLVITNGTTPLALAGIMGGAASGVGPSTKALVVEAATFDAGIIRTTAARHKIRTEGSARHEKSLDAHQLVPALQRFAHLLAQAGIAYEAGSIGVCGDAPPAIVITVEHTFIERCLGVSLQKEFVHATLTKLGFDVTERAGIYTITVPTFRATKDIAIKEDIVEEVGRFYGYSNIRPELPSLRMQPSNLTSLLRVRNIKQYMAYSAQMYELSTYAFFDEQFLSLLEWQPHNYAEVQSPVSEQWRRLVTTLVPTMFRAVHVHSADQDQLRFFEWARVWLSREDKVTEKKMLTAIIYDKKEPVDFYQAKTLVDNLFEMLKIDVQWIKASRPLDPWYAPYQTATLQCDNRTIGTMGKVDSLWFNKVAPGDACILEIDGDFLIDYIEPVKKYVPSSKYPEVVRDISVFVPLEMTVDRLQALVREVDPWIVNVEQTDMFEKAELGAVRSITLRLAVQADKTLTKEEVDGLIERVQQKIVSTIQGAALR